MSNPLPPSITAGVTFSHVFTLTAYPAPDWALKLLLRGPQVINLKAEPQNNQHHLFISASTSKDWQPGHYQYWLRLYRSQEIHELDAGKLKILTNADHLTAGYDARSHEEIVLDNINAVLEDTATIRQKRYRINNRELDRLPIDELLKLKSKYEWLVMQKRRVKKHGTSLHLRSIKWRFQ